MRVATRIIRIAKTPYNCICRLVRSIGDIMDGIVEIFDAMGDIGTIPEELESEYESKYENKPIIPCDDAMVTGWGGIIGPYSRLCFSEQCVVNDLIGCVECPITHDLFTPATIVVVTRCGHMFDLCALKRWFSVSSTCPSCRQEMDPG